MRLLILILSFLIPAPLRAHETLQLLRTIPMDARLMTVDETGNVYVVRSNNSLVKFSARGDSLSFFRSVQNGDIGAVDATNPLRVIVSYPAYGKVVLLDRMLAQKNELNLRQLNLYTGSVVAASADGNLWVYDRFNARLKKIDEQLNEIAQSNDLRLELERAPDPAFMLERDWKVFISDTVRGLYTFDRYGNYINTIPLRGIRYLQVFESRLFYRSRDTLYSWDMNKVSGSHLKLPASPTKLINAAVVRDVLYILYGDRLDFYQIISR